jgi:NhaP-type Na+/H+ or K+/H+ antiporter
MWVRETGVIPAALAGMMVAAKVPGAELISSVTFAAIFITLTFQASTAKLLAHLLKLDVAPVLETVQKEAGPQMLVLSPRAH